jgi:hypothetical protein
MQFGRGGNRVAAEEGLLLDFRKAPKVLLRRMLDRRMCILHRLGGVRCWFVAILAIPR